jgi:hypothetical protein
MQSDIRLQYEQVLNESHHGRPTVVETIHTGRPGRPRIHIDPTFLRWAHSHRSTSAIGRFLGVGRSAVRNALLDYGIVEPQSNPFPMSSSPLSSSEDANNTTADDLLDPDIAPPTDLPQDIMNSANHLNSQTADAPAVVSYTGMISPITDAELDDLLSRLRIHFRRAGISMLDGMLRRLGHHVPRERIRTSLIRVDPVQRVFQRIRIRRRVYQVEGPNALWHHDGQHG